jgi:hypothetical protein
MTDLIANKPITIENRNDATNNNIKYLNADFTMPCS